MDTIIGLFESWPAWATAITGLLTAMTFITALTPTKHDNTIVNMLLTVMNVLAGNIGQNKNADGELKVIADAHAAAAKAEADE